LAKARCGNRFLRLVHDALCGAGNGPGIDDRSRGGVEDRTRQNYASCGLPERFYDFSTTSTETQRLRESRRESRRPRDTSAAPRFQTSYRRKPQNRQADVLIFTVSASANMSRCPYCPGLQTMCETCWEKNYASPGSTRPWLPKGVPRLTKNNMSLFLFLFTFCFLQGRFHIPLFYLHAPMSTRTAALVALVGIRCCLHAGRAVTGPFSTVSTVEV
jgi:hypothetical protein